MTSDICTSASLWGCELKYINNRHSRMLPSRQPPCEAVSWNFKKTKSFSGGIQSASLWGCELKWKCQLNHHPFCSQPPCEAVSWNIISSSRRKNFNLSASLWGCELKCFEFLFSLGEIPVSLLVRLWVEIHQRSGSGKAQQGQPPCEAVSWNALLPVAVMLHRIVSLLVRLWVEMLHIIVSISFCFVSLLVRLWVEISLGFLFRVYISVSLLVRLWVEIQRPI